MKLVPDSDERNSTGLLTNYASGWNDCNKAHGKPDRVLLNKAYSAEELSDLSRDVHEAFDERFTPEAAGIPKDEHGFERGTFEVSITWKPEE